MTAIRHFNFSDSIVIITVIVMLSYILMKITVVVQFSSVSSVAQSIVFAHSFRQTNFFTLYVDRDARNLFTI